MLTAGADLLDIGGQSSRPGAVEVGAEEEWQRIEATIKGLLDAAPEALISVDTFHHEVALKALEAGAFMVNDIFGGSRDANMAQVIAQFNAPYAIMHMQGTPANARAHLVNITAEVLAAKTGTSVSERRASNSQVDVGSSGKPRRKPAAVN